MRRDIVVVGAGAAGLMAAAVAARRGHRVLLIEKNRRPGLKILISGGGRCNLTTTLAGAPLEAQYGTRRGRFLRHALRSFPPAALRAHVEALGVPLREEDLDKVFPISQRAQDVLDALVRDACEAGVELALETPMAGLSGDDAGFSVATANGPIETTRVILATGGLSYQKTGATGDGQRVARALGHTITPMVPALAPLAVDAPWLTELAGLVLDAAIAVVDSAGVTRIVRRRPVLITHRGLSGPGAMDVAGDVEECGGCTVRLDLAPDIAREKVEDALVVAARHAGRRLVQHALPSSIPERLRIALCRRHQAHELVIAELPRPLRRVLAADVKGLELQVERSLGFAHAEVTRGGVALDEVDPRTMESRVRPGLFVCGELLDVDGPIGGFNFQAAFATGRLAGEAD